MKILRLVLSSHLTEDLPLFDKVSEEDLILMCEVAEEWREPKHHKKKIAFIFCCMRRFALNLVKKGFKVKYVKIDDPNNSQTFFGEISRAIQEFSIEKIVAIEAGRFSLNEQLKKIAKQLHIPIQIEEDPRFLASHSDFQSWARGKKQLRMEFFYREMRRKYGFLMTKEGEPEGGEWNYDKENRKSFSKGSSPAFFSSSKKSDSLMDEVFLSVENSFSDHFGDIFPFRLGTNRKEALEDLDHFISLHLPFFGDYQDAMLTGEPYLYHSKLSSYMNIGLLNPYEICLKAVNAYETAKAPLNSVEGFIRQILGWREFVRGIYWLHMPVYAEMNHLGAKKPLPALYWGGTTKMACLKEVVKQTKNEAYSHHIQRLMVTGNFALLAALDVEEVQKWYLAVYSDAYEWVEMPNTLGMALFGDGGIMGSKPYLASGKYIDKMSDFCSGCFYNVETNTEKNSCPFNALYWSFLIRHRSLFEHHPRLAFMYKTWDKFEENKREKILQRGLDIFNLLSEEKL
ncbi:MAG: cryptochrome/photolyase family protein [Rhabdochlamydiaceae bacterium]